MRRNKVKTVGAAFLLLTFIYMLFKDILFSEFAKISENSMKHSVYETHLSNIRDSEGIGYFISNTYRGSIRENTANSKDPSKVEKIQQETPGEWTPNCIKLIEGDEQETRLAENYVLKNPRHSLSNLHYVNFAMDCKEFKTHRGYMLNVSTEEEAIPIAYGILVHHHVEQVERLLRIIYRPNNLYCVHVDTNADISVIQDLRAISKCFSNVFIASKLEGIVYAGFSRLQADINCMADALNSSIKWDYFINLSGEMFPLKTNLEIVKILQIYNGSNDIEGIAGMRSWGQNWKWTNTFIVKYDNDGRGKLIRTNETKLPPPHNIEIVKGSAYGVFTREFLEYALNDNLVQEFLNWTKDINSPYEVLWATLHYRKYNPIFKAPGGYKGDATENKGMSIYASWPPGDPCQGRKIHQICIPGIRDLPMIVSKKQLYFNKLKPFGYDYFVLECLEQWMQNKTASELPLETFEYRNLPFVKYKN